MADRRYRDKAWLKMKYEDEMLMQSEIAEECGCNLCTIWEWMKRYGIKGRRVSTNQTGSNNYFWKGGRCDRNGYVDVYCPSHPYAVSRKYILEHRLVMEKHLGRYLESHEIVHHKDGDRKNNKIENLELTTKREHRVGYKNGHDDGYINCALGILAYAVVENLK